MDPVSLIVASLVAGAAAGGTQVATAAVQDAYGALKRQLVARFRGHSRAAAAKQELVLAEHEQDSETYAKPMEKAIRDSGADRDLEILAAAKALLDLADRDGRIARQYNVDLRGAQGVQLGDHSHQVNRWR